ncbi:hypothetical protein [Virgisporangium aurantiacum]|uniref:Uncharacterized protein n=1 Tax=Virgisporangium aurantiacum TaxID=175570 RepID=A0A8J4E5F6_9ACTN|nr:hypothetical protein [Virgisporangium aurantiacum]GIJ63010.1 hypothetical protein Vau01_105260 [Virgisporangium aurantiacum]
MLHHAARAVPWGRVALAAGLVVVLMELVRWNPWVLWPLEGAAVGLLAGAAAWCFDETAAAVVDTSPRGLAWRAGARSPAVLLLVLTWVFAVARGGNDATFGHLEAVLVQGLAAVATGAAVACWRRAQGDASPGLLFAAITVPVATVWALVRPLGDHLAVFPYGATSSHGWHISTVGWAAAGVLAALLLIAALTDAPWWHLHRVPWLSDRKRLFERS